MKLRLLLLLLWVFVCAFSVAGQSVNEGESWIVINEKTADVSLTVESRLRTTDTPVELTLLDNTNAIRAIASQPTKFLPGKRNYKYALSIADIMKHHGDEIGWWRLSYRVGEVRGIVSLSELLRDDFDLRAAAFQRVIPGEPMRVRVRSLNPFTERAVKGVAIKAELVIEIETESDEDEDELKLQTTARTDGDGFAVLEFAIPDVKLDGDGAPELKIIGKKNGIVRDIEEDIEDDDAEPSTILTTDKPLYQPGQIFNARALLLDANHTIIAGGELEFTIEDEEGTDLFRQKVTTSAYGIASISWPIPENAKLGMYRFEVDGDGISNEDRLEFKVTRYDLPNFSVTATPDKSYYLLNDTDASISVKADYLFGKPVTNGRVRVVRESEREWNYREQKYDVKEGDSVDGTADASGKYVARFDLRKDILELRSREWTRYEDLSFAAYYTDLTTNRTEQRRFDIRLTKEPIHIYLMPSGNRHRGLPLSGYISTFYADGTPAECNVEISDETETVARLKTSSIGGGKFVFRIPQESIEGSNYDIRITAHDKKGQTGTFEESFYINDEDAIQIHMDKAIYKPRETIEMELLSSQQSGYVYVDVVKNWVPVDSRVVELHKGKAQVSIPYKPSFRGDLVIAAYSDKRTSYWSDEMRAVRGIVYPEQQNLLINAKFTKEEYRPGEDAMVRFAVYDGSRKPVESAIGLGVFDKAIEERARTESAFGEGLYSRVLGLMGYQRSFGGIALKDLNELDLSRPISAELQLAAEIMLSGGWYYPSIYHSNNRDVDASSIYKVSITAQLKPIFHALQARYEKDRDHPTDQKSLERIVSDAGINYQQLLDPWGQPYISDFSIDRTQNIVTIKTAGPDKKPGTSDDFTAGTYGFHYFRKTGEAIDRVADAYPERTESYIRDIDTLIAELAKVGIDRTHLKDRWGRDYRITFEVVGRHHVIRLRSLGPDGVYEPRDYSGDDFDVWQSHTNYFGKSELAINRILSTEVNQKKRPFPRSEAEFVNLLRSGGLDLRSIQDGYGRSVYVVGKLETKYTDKTKIENGKTTITPTTEEVMSFTLRTEGADMTTLISRLSPEPSPRRIVGIVLGKRM